MNFQLNFKSITFLFPLFHLFLFLHLCPQQIFISAGFELLSEEEPIEDAHRSIDKRSSEEYEEFIKGSGRLPMGFGKRSAGQQTNNFLLPPFTSTRLLKSNNQQGFWVIRPFIYGMHPIPRDWTV
ncbi:unnamed protein product [Meloidogyne enterolobii]|uniref:Uncharacterized protein n=1 Tax=Meloidogyne enterolobii TaxID=390850 RepID=A0ACB1ADV2_MELEN